jgi:hypothetical protein
VLRGIFGPKTDEVTGKWGKLYNEDLHDLYCSSTIVRVIKSRRMRWARHVARMGEGTGVYRILVGSLREKGQWGDPDVDWRIILRWIVRMWDLGVWSG